MLDVEFRSVDYRSVAGGIDSQSRAVEDHSLPGSVSELNGNEDP